MDTKETTGIDRREAIRRTALALGLVATSSSWTSAQAQADRPPPAGGKARYLTAAEFAAVAALAERILPRTETPGATDAGVPEFVDVSFGEYMSDGEMANFRKGLRELRDRCEAESGKGFAALSDEEQDGVIRALAEESEGVRNSFLRQLREFVILGYFSSEVVGKKVLNYLPIPGRFESCVPVESLDNVDWTEHR